MDKMLGLMSQVTQLAIYYVHCCSIITEDPSLL